MAAAPCALAPGMDAYPAAFDNPLARIGSAVWAVALVFVAIKLIVGVARMKSAEKRGETKQGSVLPVQSERRLVAFLAVLLAIGAISFWTMFLVGGVAEPDRSSPASTPVPVDDRRVIDPL